MSSMTSSPRTNSVIFWCILWLLLGALSGCSTRAVHLALDQGYPVTQKEREDLLSVMETRQRKIRSLRLLLRTTVTEGANSRSLGSSPGDHARVLRSALVCNERGDTRLDILPVGAAQTLHLLVSSSLGTTLVSPLDKTAIVSRSPNSGLLREVLHLPLAESDLCSYLTGRVPVRFLDLLTDPREAKVSCSPHLNRCLVELIRYGDQWILDRESGVILEALLFDRFRKDSSVQMQLGAIKNDNRDTELPERLHITLPQQNLALTFELIRDRLNSEIPDSLFEVFIPSDYRLVRQ